MPRNRACARFLEKRYTSLFDGRSKPKNPLNAAVGLAVQDTSGAGATALSTASTIPCKRLRGPIWTKGQSGALAAFDAILARTFA